MGVNTRLPFILDSGNLFGNRVTSSPKLSGKFPDGLKLKTDIALHLGLKLKLSGIITVLH